MNQETDREDEGLLERVLSKLDKRVPHFLTLTYFLGFALCLFVAYKYFDGRGQGKELNAREIWFLSLLAVGMFGLFLMNEALMVGRIRRLENAQEWLINTTHWTIGRIKANGLHCVLNEQEQQKNNVDPQKWPWGAHHTEQLGHLEAAALRWWQNYDPTQSDTAPKNELVSDWLIRERGVSKDKARAIASILRADGLPAGRR